MASVDHRSGDTAGEPPTGRTARAGAVRDPGGSVDGAGPDAVRGAAADASMSRPSDANTPGATGRDRRRVILLTGPSGAGKSRLSARLSATHGWPVVRLDDFYREASDPALPRSPLGIPDWDHEDSWDAASAVGALRLLVDEGRVEVPVYEIGASAVTGRHVVHAGPTDFVLAEGLFAGRLVEPLRREGLLADALCVRQNRTLTALRRFVRDLSERRKPPHILVRRGLALWRDEPRVVAEARAHGARCLHPREAESELGALLGAGSPA
ncbi:uridine kinase [Terracoccus sp. 273MFTsu3.1]|uniref:uridine kinase family protein n=1 Tax=Terracoccus sp. 273MFTsu3.1 TaxID=1172188 RepID=UPI001E5AC8AC|nr:uridine kinase [Terracoccus sp. 273MFTsu3.1]